MTRRRIGKNEYCVTRQAKDFNNKASELAKGIEIAGSLGRLRQDIWNKYGSLQAWGQKSDKLIKEFKQTNPPSLYQVAYKPWERTFQSVIDDIHAVQEAARSFVVRKIYRNFVPESKIVQGKKEVVQETSFRAELISALKTTKFLDYPLLKRWVRQEYHRGRTWVNNQIVLDASDCTITRSGSIVTISLPGKPISKNRYERISLQFKCGRVKPTGRLRIIFEGNEVKLCYPKILIKTENNNTSIIGIDKGYTEGFYGSDNVVYADGIGRLMTLATDRRHSKGRKRQKLWALSRKNPHSKIKQCNLGNENQKKSETKIRATLRTKIRAGVHQIFNNHKQIVCEDLSQPIRNKRCDPAAVPSAKERAPRQRKSKKINRRLAAWCKGELQQAIDQVSQRRQSVVTLINPAYTSQVDNRNGTLLGRRDGDRFFTFDGEVLQADSNAASNIEQRLTDSEISRFQKAETVQKILLKRTASFLTLKGLTLEEAVDLGWLDSKHLKRKKAKKAVA